MTSTVQSSASNQPPKSDFNSLFIEKAILWDDSSASVSNEGEIESKTRSDAKSECLALLSDKQWQSVCAIKDLIDLKYGAQTTTLTEMENVGRTIESESDNVPWTNSDLQQLDEWLNKCSLPEHNNKTEEVCGAFQHLCSWENQCKALYNELNDAVQYLETLHDTYAKVSYKTNSLYKACEQLLADQAKLSNITECIENRLSYFDDVDRFAQSTFKQSLLYKNQMKKVLSKVLQIIKQHIINTLQSSSNNIDPSKNHTLLSDDAYTLFYGRFRINAPKVKVLSEELEQRCTKNPEYEKTLTDCHECYTNQRRMLLTYSIASAIQDLAVKHERDMCTLVRSGCAFVLHLCQDEYQLFYQFFSKRSSQVDTMLSEFCNQLYDVLRSRIIYVVHLETLAELVTILKIEMIEEHVKPSAKELSTFEAICTQMLEDVQERLVYRTQVYIRDEILKYNPSPGDVAYPEKLEMMQKISQSIKEQHLVRHPSQSSTDSNSTEVFFETIFEPIPSSISSLPAKDGQSPKASPADLHGMWYPTVRRTLVCLSKLFRCLDRNIFQGLSQETLTMCVQSLIKASDLIIKRKTLCDGRLFLIKHLLILREQIAPFNIDLAVKEMVLDFSKLKEAAMKFLTKKSKMLSLQRDNAFLDFLLQGTLQVKESFIDSKREVDKQLKQSCESYISDVSTQLCGNIRQYLQKAEVILKMNDENNNTNIQKVSLRQQPFAKPDVLHEIIIENYNYLKKNLPDVLKTMSLYLANKDTEQILFKPIKTNIQQTYQELIILIRDHYSEEDLQIISCPSQEQTRRRLQTITKQDNSQQISYNNYQPQTTKVHPVFIETVQSLPQPSLFLTNNNNSSTEKTILTIMSNGRDRTNEFLTTVKTFQSRRNDYVRPSIPPAPSTKKTASTIQQSHQFMQSAKQIGQDLSQTFVKLEQLTIIAKQSSLFHDKSAEIQDLTSAIKQDIGNLNKQIAQLQQYMHSTNGIKSKNSQTHSNSVVFVLQSKLAIMSNDFKQVLEARTHNLKEQKSRRDNFSKNTVASAGHPISMNGIMD
ncbi:unnamed protein product [Didymodactylos carnosus]|uniref:Conserved oligomeric Golgi complex subunit 3 n=1 Tax=Didymodactylos carnosus TaxID=1234261 RepID=A0A8S2CSV0_9BILA|nr:unnamed protein product [Didymodactylos carnosus]CAF3577251.1 unnamed protein product [Didymodactylos carnosus]